MYMAMFFSLYIIALRAHAHTHTHTHTHTHIVFLAVVVDVLLFQNYLFQKQSGPYSIDEGQVSKYSVRLDGPPPNDVEISINAADNLIRYIPQSVI